MNRFVTKVFISSILSVGYIKIGIEIYKLAYLFRVKSDNWNLILRGIVHGGTDYLCIAAVVLDIECICRHSCIVFQLVDDSADLDSFVRSTYHNAPLLWQSTRAGLISSLLWFRWFPQVQKDMEHMA